MGTLAKNLGAYYTHRSVADLLVTWAVRTPTDLVMDPSSGDGVFLAAAARTIQRKGGEPARQVLGFDVDAGACESARSRLRDEGLPTGIPVECRDFFDLPSSQRQVDAVVGNPPFIRYHRFAGEVRGKGLLRAAEQGVRLSGLSSSWAPFLVHCVSMVVPGGRLAMVVPFEVTYALYARPVLAFLAETFGKVEFLGFRQKLFPHLNEHTVLLLAEGKGQTTTRFGWREFGSIAEVEATALRDARPGETGCSFIESQQVLAGREKLGFTVLTPKQRDLYRGLQAHPRVRCLGTMAEVGIGYVTGANTFFHISPQTAAEWRLPATCLRPAVLRGGGLRGVQFTGDDWQAGLASGDTGLLLHVTGDTRLPDALAEYLRYGESRGVCLSFKCRNRHPWYRVPQVTSPSAFLTCMSGMAPKLVANRHAAVAPNTLLAVSLRVANGAAAVATAVSWRSSLTTFSAEVEGHALGGGMLKLEPAEARRVLLPAEDALAQLPGGLDREADILCRQGRPAEARVLIDRELLVGILGLSQADCQLLHAAAEALRARRYSHPKGPPA